jgi:hypothetical protein
MKLTKKQEAIKAKILAETHVLYTGEFKRTEDGITILHTFPRDEDWNCTSDYYAIVDGFISPIDKNEIKDRPIINMSEWFEEIEESTKDMREYDEKLLKDYNVFVIENDLEEYLPRARRKFIQDRYTNEALLKEKEELEARLKEIEEQLGSEG